MLAHCLGPAGLDRIVAVVMPEYRAPCHVAEKAGMHLEGIATYYGIAGLKVYAADRGSWSSCDTQ